MASYRDKPGGREEATYLPKEEVSFSFPPDRTALLVIDPVNDLLSEGGAGWEMTRNSLKMNNVIYNIKQAVERARLLGIPVLFSTMAYVKEDYEYEQLQRRSGINRLMFEKKMCLAGSWGAQFHPELLPAEGDTVLLPHKGVDVFETDLPGQLDRLGTTHLVIAGMTANMCCESTGRHAMEAGLDVTFLSDAIGAVSVMAYEAAIRVNYPLIANAVITVEEFLAATDTPAAQSIAVQSGDTVRGSDHLEIGTVDKVVDATLDAEGYLLVRRGLVFHKDTYIPLEAVVKRAGSNVFINIPKVLVAAMPWSQPPTRLGRQVKQGPSSADLGNLHGSHSASVANRRLANRRAATDIVTNQGEGI